jgi:hypothetical protein
LLMMMGFLRQLLTRRAFLAARVPQVAGLASLCRELGNRGTIVEMLTAMAMVASVPARDDSLNVR